MEIQIHVHIIHSAWHKDLEYALFYFIKMCLYTDQLGSCLHGVI